MAVSNALGSNVFDINLGLGLPFLIKTIIKNGQPVLLLTPVELVKSSRYCEKKDNQTGRAIYMNRNIY